MKKNIIILLLTILFPNVVSAACDAKAFVQYQKLADNVTYETSYSKSANKFSVTFYNVVPGLYITDSTNYYSADLENIIYISNIEEGKSVSYIINTSETDCGSLIKTISINFPYYNTFYETDRCDEYKGKLSICSSQFLNYKPTLDIFELQVKNLGGIELEKPIQEPDNRTIIDDIVDFMKDWGIQIAIVVVVSVITIIPFNAKLRKVKHGI